MDRTINVILKPLRRFAMQKPNASILLFMAMILAMLFANSPWAESYHNILSHPIDLKIGNFTPFMHHGEVMPMLAFVNDALMAVFFFVIGLEIKQEILIGELSSVREALLPIIALRRDDRSGIVLFSGLSFGTRSARCGYSDGDRYRLCLGCFRVVGKTGSTQHAYFFDGIGGGG